MIHIGHHKLKTNKQKFGQNWGKFCYALLLSPKRFITVSLLNSETGGKNSERERASRTEVILDKA